MTEPSSTPPVCATCEGKGWVSPDDAERAVVAGGELFNAGYDAAGAELTRLCLALEARTKDDGNILSSVVVDCPGRPVAAPCALSGCHYSELEARTQERDEARDAVTDALNEHEATRVLMAHVEALKAAKDAAEAKVQALEAALQGLAQRWYLAGAVTDSFHATMGIGWKACAKELTETLEALARPTEPQKDGAVE